MGWLEMLKSSKPGTEVYDETVYEIEDDVDKLKKITGRFSKIGSQPKLNPENVGEVIQNVSDYFEKRIPNLVTKEGKVTKKVRVEVNSPEKIKVKINKDLFEWVIENLLKNALDAIDKPSGLIVFNISEKDKEIFIDVSDNGKGIDKKYRKDVFRPGYSTKLRGWGLGLSLSKRIIEDYHKGKLILIESVPEQGTTFRIKLNKK
jgi:signal transduction histidine kinase